MALLVHKEIQDLLSKMQEACLLSWISDTRRTTMSGILRDLMRPRNCRTRRISSWDKTGGNRDNWPVASAEAKTLADITGPGVITHISMTSGA